MTMDGNNTVAIHGTLVYLGPVTPGSAGVRGTFNGYYFDPPIKGSRFRVFQGSDYIDTSTVQRIDKMLSGSLLITTERSVYEWVIDKSK